MAEIRTSLCVETDLISDAVQEVAAIQRALATRHGEAFRILERRIAALLNDTAALPRIHILIGGVFIAQPSAETIEIIRDARALGVG